MSKVLFKLGAYEVRRAKPVEVWNTVLDACVGTFESQRAAREYVEELATNRALVSAFGVEGAAKVLDDERKLTSGELPLSIIGLGRAPRLSDLADTVEQSVCKKIKEKMKTADTDLGLEPAKEKA